MAKAVLFLCTMLLSFAPLAAAQADVVVASIFELSSARPVTVWVDGKEVGNTPLILDALPVGEHVLSASAADLPPWELTVHVNRDTGIQILSIPTDTVPGKVNISADEAGARVELDGRPAGVTPLALAAVPAGEHFLVVIGKQSMSDRISVRVKPGDTLNLKPALLPRSLLVVNGSLPLGARITVKKGEQFLARQQLPNLPVLLAAGEYEVSIELAGQEPWKTSLKADGTSPAPLDIRGWFSAGTIRFPQVSPSVRVTLDGAIIDHDSLKEAVPTWAGSHLLKMENMQGYSFDLPFWLSDGSATEIAALVPALKSGLTPAKITGLVAPQMAADQAGTKQMLPLMMLLAGGAGLVLNLDYVAANLSPNYQTYATVKYASLGLAATGGLIALVSEIVALASSE